MKLFIGSIYKRISSTPIGSNKADSHSFKSKEVIQSELQNGQLRQKHPEHTGIRAKPLNVNLNPNEINRDNQQDWDLPLLKR